MVRHFDVVQPVRFALFVVHSGVARFAFVQEHCF
jgi:hypothetical protein